MQLRSFAKKEAATSIALLFHVCGAIGMIWSPYKDWFVRCTSLNLLLMAALLIWTQPGKNRSFFLFLVICFLTGITAEQIGVHTGLLFGNYTYGDNMGLQWNKVPWIIGLNWFIIIFCCGCIMTQINTWVNKAYARAGLRMPVYLQTFSIVVDGALMAVFFDWLMEPVAMQLHFWQWQDRTVTSYNYLCWFAISMALLLLFRYLRFNKANFFTVHLFIIQVLFFMALRTYLK